MIKLVLHGNLKVPRAPEDPLFLFKCQVDQADDADGDAEAHAADVPGMTSSVLEVFLGTTNPIRFMGLLYLPTFS